jgi:alanine dehydrogenase
LSQEGAFAASIHHIAAKWFCRKLSPVDVSPAREDLPVSFGYVYSRKSERSPLGKANERYAGMNLDETVVGRLLRMQEVIPAMERALADFSSGKVVQPMRVMLPVAEHQGFLGLMPAYTGTTLGTKLVAFYPHNTGVPTHHATILLFKPETGEPLVTMDGRLITEVRTAAVSAVATDRLAKSDASVLGIIGSGVQARSHLEALRLVRDFGEVRVWSPRRSAEFAREHSVHAAASAEEAVEGAEVVVVATTSPHPVLCGEWLSPGVHINAVGAPRPDWRELDDEVLQRARVYVDSREAALKESGDVIAAGKIFAEIGEVVAGTREGRQSTEEVTLFKSLGLAVEDVATAELVYRKALDEEDTVEVRSFHSGP